MRRAALALVAFLSAFTLGAQTIPRPSPDFEVQFAGGKPIKISDYRGKVVCFVFILTT